MKTIFILLITLVLTGCSKSELDPQLSREVDYCPLSVGCWIDYDVTAIKIDVATQYYDTVQYVMREHVDAMIDSSADEQKYRIVRTVKFPDNPDWQDLDAVLVIKNTHALIRQENNTPVISISYPVSLRKRWRGYALHSDDTASFKITKMWSEASFADTVLDSILTVVQKYEESLVQIEDNSEQYAAGVGLVEKHNIIAYSDDISLDDMGQPIPVLERALTATIFRQTYLAQGKYQNH